MKKILFSVLTGSLLIGSALAYAGGKDAHQQGGSYKFQGKHTEKKARHINSPIAYHSPKMMKHADLWKLYPTFTMMTKNLNNDEIIDAKNVLANFLTNNFPCHSVGRFTIDEKASIADAVMSDFVNQNYHTSFDNIIHQFSHSIAKIKHFCREYRFGR